MRDLGLGVLLTAALGGLVVWPVWGSAAAVSAVACGLFATVLHFGAVELLKGGLGASFEKLMARWAMGLGLRLAGVVVFGTAIYLAEDVFPALPSAVGFGGVLLPLLFSEVRLLR